MVGFDTTPKIVSPLIWILLPPTPPPLAHTFVLNPHALVELIMRYATALHQPKSCTQAQAAPGLGVTFKNSLLQMSKRQVDYNLVAWGARPRRAAQGPWGAAGDAVPFPASLSL